MTDKFRRAQSRPSAQKDISAPTGTPHDAPSSPPVLTAEEEAVAPRFLAEGGGEAKTRLHKKMQSGF